MNETTPSRSSAEHHQAQHIEPWSPWRRGLRIRTVMIALVIVAVVTAMGRDLGLGLFFIPVVITIGLIGLEQSQQPHELRLQSWLRFLGGLGAAVTLELIAAALAYHTIGDIDHGLYLFIIPWSNLVAVLTFACGFRRVAAGGLILVFLLVVPYQAFLGLRWARAHAETVAIIEYLESVRERTGRYPDSLDNYDFERPDVVDFIWYKPDPEESSYYVGYHVGTTTTTHSYDPEGGWFYYPD